MSLIWLWWLLTATGVLGAGLLVLTIRGIITRSKIRSHADSIEKDKGREIYILIKEKHPNYVTADVVDKWGDKEGEVEYNSDSGVDSDLYEGLKI